MKAVAKIFIVIFAIVGLGAFLINFAQNTREEMSENPENEKTLQELGNVEIGKEVEVEKKPINAMDSITIEPRVIYPGDPVLITFISSSTPKEISWNGKKLSVFSYDNLSRAFVPISFEEKN